MTSGSIFRISALASLFVLTGCMSVADMAGYDRNTMNEQAAKSYGQLVQQARSRQVLDTTSATSGRVHRVFERLIPVADRVNRTGTPFQWQMSVIRSNELNAWAMPGGKMAVYTGMVERLNLTDDEIAAIVGHEMSHALLEHSRRALGGQVLAGIGGALLAEQTGLDSNLIGLGTDLAANKPFSRHQENEADALGVRLMARAGYNPQAAINVWNKLNAAGSTNGITILSTHPANESRIRAIQAMMPELMQVYRQNRR